MGSVGSAGSVGIGGFVGSVWFGFGGVYAGGNGGSVVRTGQLGVEVVVVGTDRSCCCWGDDVVITRSGCRFCI